MAIYLPQVPPPTTTNTVTVSGAITDISANNTYKKTDILSSPIPGVGNSYIWTTDEQDSYPRIVRHSATIWILFIGDGIANYYTSISIDPTTGQYPSEYYTGQIPTTGWTHITTPSDQLTLTYIGDVEITQLDTWSLSSTEYPPTNTYYCNNNRIYYDQSNIDKNVLNQLDQKDKYLSNFSYPDELAFGINYSRANNRRLGIDNFRTGMVYNLYLNTYITE